MGTSLESETIVRKRDQHICQCKRVTQQQEQLNRIGKRVPSREKAEDVRRIALSLDGKDEALLNDVADLLLELRQTIRGGRLNVPGGKHWPSDNGHPSGEPEPHEHIFECLMRYCLKTETP